ncbi:MAG: CDC48 family AAA ATPase [Methanosarcinales archaeon]|nr:CDC48 family AAA ATPase [Methanosarcinales archaeon]
MPLSERDTIGAIKLKVDEADQKDVGKGVVRIDESNRNKIGINLFDIVMISGERDTSAIVGRAYPSDEEKNTIRMDGLTRINAKTGIGEFVTVQKVQWHEARNVSLAPVTSNIRMFASSESLQGIFLNRTVSKGDLISTTSVRKHKPESLEGEAVLDELLSDFFGGQPFGLGEIKLQVVSTKPQGIVKITEITQIELIPESVELPEQVIPEVMYEDLGGIKQAITKVREMIELPLKHPELFSRLGIDPPKGILLHGPPGTGKTMLAKAVANESNVYFLTINGPEIMSKFYGESEQRLREMFDEAEKNAPSIIFIDEIDSIAPKRAEVFGEVERRVVAQLLSLMDGLKSRKNVIVIGATNRPEALDMALRRPGRFDREIELRVPNTEGRLEIFQIHTRGMPLTKDADLEQFSEITYGFVGADIAALTKEAAMNSLRRILPEIDLDQHEIPQELLNKLSVTLFDFEEAMKEVQPSALREILFEVPNVTWEDIGGLEKVKEQLQEAVEWPLRFGESYKRIGVESSKGILLYGPPGTGKTMLAKAIANESDANFITAKGSDLLSKWYGESEKHIAGIFKRARQVAPAIVFLDELDSLAPVRGGSMGEPQVTERIVNQLLSEMDGLEELKGVVVIGATNRPDIIDPALIRSGRFDELILVPVPDSATRKKIFGVHTKEMALDDDVNIDELMELTNDYTGADIAYLCNKAGRFALRENMECKSIKQEHFLMAIKDSGPSVSSDTMKYYESLKSDLRKKHSKQIEANHIYG